MNLGKYINCYMMNKNFDLFCPVSALVYLAMSQLLFLVQKFCLCCFFLIFSHSKLLITGNK